MNANRHRSRSMSLIIVSAMLLGLVLSSASAQEVVLVLAATGGNGQTAAIGTAYALPLQVTVTNDGAPVAGVLVEFLAPSDPAVASVNPNTFTAITDATGVASATVTANWYAGLLDILASHGGQTVTFHLTNTGTLAISGGEGQSAVVGTAYAQPLQVKITDAAGPVAGAQVKFVAPVDPGVASLNPTPFTVTTDASGVASATVTANGFAGAFEVHAEYGGQTVIFHLTNTGRLTLEISGGDYQSAATGTAYANPLQVTVTDAAGPVAGVIVEFVAPSSGASLNPATFTAMTDANGVASAAVTANQYAGAFEVQSSYGGQTAVFSLTNSGPQAVSELPVLMNINPYEIVSRCEFNDGVYGMDPRADGNRHVCETQTTATDCQKYNFCWWRDTWNQNVLSQHTADDYTDSVVVLYTSSTLNVYEYVSPFTSNVVLLTTAKNYMIVGCGGGTTEATYIKGKLASYITGKTLRSVVMPDANIDSVWGCRAWTRGSVNFYASWLFEEELEQHFFIESALIPRQQRLLGTFLPWGEDAFLGSGIGKEMRAVPPQYWQEPSILISERTDIYLDGNKITLIPATLGDAEDLLVYVPDPGIVIVENWGTYLPDVGGILDRSSASVTQAADTLDFMRTLVPLNIIAPLHGRPVLDSSKILSDLLTQRDIVQWIRDRTIMAINNGDALNDMVDAIKLPASLASSPYAKELASTVPMIVRNVYQQYMGWFDGQVEHLESMPTINEALREVEYGGGENAVLNYVKKCLSEHTHEGVLEGLRKLSALRKVYPSERADSYYIQALKMLAFDAKSAYLRNYYLSEIQEVQSP